MLHDDDDSYDFDDSDNYADDDSDDSYHYDYFNISKMTQAGCVLRTR